MLRLRQQVGGDERRVRTAIGDDQHFRGPGRHVDRGTPVEHRDLALGLGDESVARAEELVALRNARVPKAIAAIACTPPSAKTRRMPQLAAAYSTAGSTLPSRRGGVHSTMSGQPASAAGTPSMSAVDGNGAEPAGT